MIFNYYFFLITYLGIVEKRVEKIKNHGANPDDEDVLGILVQSLLKNPGGQITVETIIDKFFNLFNAAIDTTSSLMSFCILKLALDQELQEKLR